MIVALVSNPAKGENRLTGAPKIITGDTLEIAGRLVHLVGVDAPEMAQRCRLADGRAFDCGLVAKTALMDLTVGGPVSCTLQTEQAIPPIALCKAGGYDLSKGMAHTGWALAWPRRERFTRELNDMRARKFMGSGRDALLRRGIGVGARGNKIWGQESQNNVVRHGR